MMGLKCAKRKPFVDKKVHHHGMYFYGTRKNSILIFFDKVLVSGYPKCLYVSESLECDLSSGKFVTSARCMVERGEPSKKGQENVPPEKVTITFEPMGI